MEAEAGVEAGVREPDRLMMVIVALRMSEKLAIAKVILHSLEAENEAEKRFELLRLFSRK